MQINFNILEAEDGIETLYFLYKAAFVGAKISLVLSDQNMSFMNGIRSSILLKEIADKKKMGHIPFYIVTAYDTSLLDKHVNCTVNKILDKPLSRDIAFEIIQEMALSL